MIDREKLMDILNVEYLTQDVRQRIADKIKAEFDKDFFAPIPPKNKIEPLELIHSADGYWYAKDKNTEAIYCALMFIEKKINEIIADRNKQ